MQEAKLAKAKMINPARLRPYQDEPTSTSSTSAPVDRRQA